MLDLHLLRWRLARSKLRVPLVWLRHRGLRRADVFVAGYPKTGTTWLRFLLFEALSGREATFGSVNPGIPDLWEKSKAVPLLPDGGRLLKTHEVYRPEYRKAIYVVRDVRDVIVSEYFFLDKMRHLNGQDFDAFLVDFLENKVNNFGSWGEHVESWLAAKADGRADVLIVRYEDMLDDTEGQLHRIMTFLGAEVADEVLPRVIRNNAKERMRKKEDRARETAFKHTRSDIRFIRKATAGGWRDTVDAEQLRHIEQRTGATLQRLGYELHTALV